MSGTGAEFESPAPLVAKQVSVIPAMSVVEPQPLDDAMPDSGSVTLQLTVTVPVYQPFAPIGPLTVGTITGWAGRFCL